MWHCDSKLITREISCPLWLFQKSSSHLGHRNYSENHSNQIPMYANHLMQWHPLQEAQHGCAENCIISASTWEKCFAVLPMYGSQKKDFCCWFQVHYMNAEMQRFPCSHINGDPRCLKCLPRCNKAEQSQDTGSEVFQSVKGKFQFLQ